MHDIRRHPDGSIDCDFYRASAHALRAHALRAQAVRKVSLRGAASIGAAALAIAALVVMPAHVNALASAIRRVLEAALEIG